MCLRFSSQTHTPSVIAERVRRTELNANGSIIVIPIFMTAMLMPQIKATDNKHASANRLGDMRDGLNFSMTDLKLLHGSAAFPCWHAAINFGDFRSL